MNDNNLSKSSVPKEKHFLKVYLLVAIIFGFIIMGGVGDVLFQWSYSLYSEWTSSLLWNFWLPCSGIILLVFLARRIWFLTISPAAFLSYFIILMFLGPILSDSETSQAGNQQKLELVDLFSFIFGLFYTGLNVFLLKRQCFGSTRERITKISEKGPL